MIDREIRLHGQFKFDIFNKDGSLDYTTSYIDNFITPTGLSYPNIFSFADCFRYLSIGTGTGANFVTGIGTTGLSSPIRQTGFQYVGGNGDGVTDCTNTIPNGYLNGACGYRVSGASGLSLYRGWRIPSSGTYFTGSGTFNEYMLSPGRPRINAYINTNTGIISSGLCHCNQNGYLSPGLTGPVYGLETFDFYSSYPTICESEKAFSRILKTITVSQNQYLLVSYSLNINFDTNTNFFNLTPVRTSPIGGDYNWHSISGLYSLVHPGLKVINNGVVKSVVGITQMNNSYAFRVGESFMPPLGIPLEPSCPLENRFGYLSNDILQFKFNDMIGGKLTIADFQPYAATGRNFPSGNMRFHKDWIVETSNSLTSLGGAVPSYLNKPRSENNNNPALAPYPNPANFKLSTDYLTACIIVSTLQTVQSGISDQIDTTLVSSGRNRSRILSYQFVEPALTETGLPVRALVMGYKPLGATNYYPNVDVVFAPYNSPITGNINTGASTYTPTSGMISGDIFPGPVITGYSFMDNNNILQFQFNLNWSSPCDSSVVGC